MKERIIAGQLDFNEEENDKIMFMKGQESSFEFSNDIFNLEDSSDDDK